MEHLVMQFFNKGMRLDLSPSNASNEYAYENQNIRITCRDGDTLFSSTNERGTVDLNVDLIGHVIGCCPFGDKAVIFSAAENDIYDRIYLFDYTNGIAKLDMLYHGNLKFNKDHRIDSMYYYETEFILKVYWIDGLNQPRFINIASPLSIMDKWEDSSFDFVPYIVNNNSSLNCQRESSSGGRFKSGVVQYAVSYLNSNGVETNLFLTTDLNYILNKDRGGKVDEDISCSFRIVLNNPDLKFQYARLYSIYRTSIDATPITKVVSQSKIDNSSFILFIDNNTTGYDVDPQSLYFIGGEKIIPYTMELKDGTLFLGNYSYDILTIPLSIKDKCRLLTVGLYEDDMPLPNKTGFYQYYNQSFNDNKWMKMFLPGLKYRLGFVGIHETGRYSEVMYVKDLSIDDYPSETKDHRIKNYKFMINLLDNDIKKFLKDNNYTHVAPVIVYPDVKDRNIIASGILCPTVYNLDDRKKKTIDIYSSWFARPNIPYESYTFKGNGWYNEYMHDKPIFNNSKLGSEIQSIHDNIPNIITDIDDNKRAEQIQYYSNNFIVDQSVLTFHSPDISLTEDLANTDLSGYKLKVNGIVLLDSFKSDMQVTITGDNVKSGCLGLYRPNIGLNMDNTDIDKKAFLLSTQCLWNDGIYNAKDPYKLIETAYPIYPWHRNGSLTNATSDSNKSMLKENKLSNLRYSHNTVLCRDIGESVIYDSIGSILYIDNNKDKVYRLNQNGEDLIYRPNVDKISVAGQSGYPLCTTLDVHSINRDPETAYKNKYVQIPTDVSDTRVSHDPVSIKYSSDKHVVITLNSAINYDQSVLPYILSGGLNFNRCMLYYKGYQNRILKEKIKATKPDITEIIAYTKDKSKYTGLDGLYIYQYQGTVAQGGGLYISVIGAWVLAELKTNWYYYALEDDTNISRVDTPALFYVPHQTTEFLRLTSAIYLPELSPDTVFGSNNNKPYFFYGELYNNNISNLFGGTTESALQNNTWYLCGDLTKILDTDTIIYYRVGDTYYQRYDALKTYPSSLTDQNNVTDIISFMCMSHINIDGRSDSNRGLYSNLTVNPDNFNLINHVYDQLNNFFSYKYLDSERYKSSNFKSDVVWSLPKTPGLEVDPWTNINTVSSLQLDGDKGYILKLVKFNNEIFCIQQYALSHIMFNSRVQLATSDNIPIEISNSNRVDGKRYISNTIGTNNKDSVCVTPNGIYFSDDKTNSIYIFDGQLILSLSDLHLMRNWVARNLSSLKPIRTFYDHSNSDVYFINRDTALCFSEYVNAFTSFMSYENTDYMFNDHDNFLSIKNNKIWKMFDGDYNIFFGQYKPYSMTFIANQNPLEDKVFNIVEYQADFYDEFKMLNHNKTFSSFDIWNEYLNGSYLLDKYNKNVVKRFRNWRLQVPRDSSNNMDRIRNPWCFFKLSNINNDKLNMKFNNVMMHYMK